jgi:hypothetical protein
LDEEDVTVFVVGIAFAVPFGDSFMMVEYGEGRLQI